MRSKPPSCIGCQIHSHGTDFSQVEGTGSSGVMLVAEASGEHEQRDQLPLRPYAPSGSVLERVIQRMGLRREMFSITNTCRCRPRNNWLENSPWEHSALAHCRPNLDAAIARYRPRCIVALGGVALRELTGMAGEKLGITYLAGYPLPLQQRGGMPYDGTKSTSSDASPTTTSSVIPVVGDFHPAYLRRGKASYQGVFARILQRALNIASGKDQDYMWGHLPEERFAWTEAPPQKEYSHGPLRYSLHPGLEDAQSFTRRVFSNSNLVVSYDLETSETTSLDEDAREGFADTTIRTIQFSLGTGEGICFPWDGGYKLCAQQILHASNVKCGHHAWIFDNRVLRAVSDREGVDYNPRGVVHDTLQMFHHWQPDLPAHLQFCSLFVNFPFPWKHLSGTNLEFYGSCDVDATLRLYHFLRARLEAEGLWDDLSYQRVIEVRDISTTVPSVIGNGNIAIAPVPTLSPVPVGLVAEPTTVKTNTFHVRGYVGQVAEVRPILAAMEDRGVPIDDAARQRLGQEFDAAQKELGVELARLAPVECSRVHPKEGYKTVPPEVRKWLTEHNLSNVAVVGGEPVSQTLFGDSVGLDELYIKRFQDPHKKQKDGSVEEGEWYTYQRRSFKVAQEQDGGGDPILADVERWCRVYDFNPNSQQQVLAYMKAKSHPIPKDKHREDEEGNNPDTTNAKELTRLANKTGDSFYLKVIEYRGYTKMKGTYIDGFKPGADRRVHTTFTFDTAIAQLSARNPNTTNFPKLKPTPKLAKAMRGMICADPGYVIGEWDFKSCHVITLGFLAEDWQYMRLGRLDIHSFVAGHFLGLWKGEEIVHETDEQLLKRFKWLKSNPEWKLVRDDQAKHGILGIGNGLSPRGLFERYMESFPVSHCTGCDGKGKVRGARGLKNCTDCKGLGKQSGMRTAEKVLEVCHSLFPKVFEYQALQRKEAHEQRVLSSQFGYIRRFYEVYRPDPKGGWMHGDQMEQAVAYRLANAAHAHMRETMKQIARQGLDEKYGLFNMVHDSLMFHFRRELLDEHVREVYPIMTAPSTVLRHPTICPDGLAMGVEASWGPRWNEMSEIDLHATNATKSTITKEVVPNVPQHNEDHQGINLQVQ